MQDQVDDNPEFWQYLEKGQKALRQWFDEQITPAGGKDLSGLAFEELLNFGINSVPAINRETVDNPNKRYQDIIHKLRTAVHSNEELDLSEKYLIDKELQSICDDLDKNLEYVAQTIINERYLKTVSILFKFW
jgi:hypothetical protein